MNKNRDIPLVKRAKYLAILGFVFFCVGFARAQQVHSSIDTAAVKIGEKIGYHIEVESDGISKIKLPEGQTFAPFEVFDSTAVDTFMSKNKMKLKREYSLIKFDSGAYTIPRQKILVDGRSFYTDSFEVKVNNVVVDTTKQKIYPIKPALNIEPPFSIGQWVWYILGGIIVLVALGYVIVKARRKIIEKKKDLPPYEKAIRSLETLDNNKQLERGQVKEYYSSLSEAVKRYVDEKIDDRALESTTSEFITLLKAYKEERKIYLKEQVIDSLDAILKRADLAKFAGINTDKLTAREDRQTIEDNIQAFDQAIPEPTEEELMRDEAYRRQQEHKRKKRKRLIVISAVVLAILVAAGTFVGVKGLDYAKELVYTQPTKRLLQNNDWITSEYGSLGITVTTPDVLVRRPDSIPQIFPRQSKTEERFAFGKPTGNFYTEVINVRFKKSSDIDSLNVGELLDHELNSNNISNATFKHDDFTTLQDRKGQKVYGTYTIENPLTKSKEKKSYTFLLFNERGGLQELMISYDNGDESAEKLENRIVNSVEFKEDQAR